LPCLDPDVISMRIAGVPTSALACLIERNFTDRRQQYLANP
jgi:hypothetical protein